MTNALFFDIDGTLYDPNAALPPSAKQALELTRAAGNQVIICTGRSLFQIPAELRGLCDGLVASTGAYVEAGGKILYEHFMPREETEHILDYFRGKGGYIQFQTETGLIMTQYAWDRSLERFTRLKRPPEVIHMLLSSAKITEDRNAYRNVKKAVFFDTNLPFEAVEQEFMGKMDAVPMSFFPATAGSGELTCLGINKSFGMARYLEAMQIPRERVYAFGDGFNDMDMLDFAGVGVAMGNAVPQLKEMADFVTKSVTEDGIYHALAHFGLLNP